MHPTIWNSNNLPAEQFDLVQKAIDYEKASLSPNTLRSYKSMWKKFDEWCKSFGIVSFPCSSETIALYLSSIGSSVSFSTLDSTIAAIEAYHERGGESVKGDPSLFRRIRKGIRRSHKENQSIRQAPALTVLDLKGVCCNLGRSLKDLRDKALITVAFFGAFRRSELSALDVGDLDFSDRGVTISILQSKTSDTRQRIYLSFARDEDICPVKSLQDWLSGSYIQEGAIFRAFYRGNKPASRISGHSISAIIKQYFGKKYSGHSARRGLVTASAEKGTSIHIIKKHSRHRSADMVLRYIEESQSFEDSAVKVLGV